MSLDRGVKPTEDDFFQAHWENFGPGPTVGRDMASANMEQALTVNVAQTVRHLAPAAGRVVPPNRRFSVLGGFPFWVLYRTLTNSKKMR
jgi:hypothetical protein